MPLSVQLPLLLGVVSAVIASLGLLAVAMRRGWTDRQSGPIALAAGGLLLTLSLAHIVPEALVLSPVGGELVLGGFVLGLVISFATGTFFPEGRGSGLAAAITPLVAIALHSFLDGVIYSVTFAASFASGLYSALPLILHEFAEGIIAFAILARHGVSLRPSLAYAFLAAAATTPLGAAMSAPFLSSLGEDVVASLFAISAGLLLYLATGTLLKPLNEETPARAGGALAAGILAGLAMLALPLHREGQHVHDHASGCIDPAGIHNRH